MRDPQSESNRIGFVMEQALGHVTHTQVLRHRVSQDTSIKPDWVLVPQHASDIWERVPRYSIRLSLRARSLIRRLPQYRGLDCLFFFTHAVSLFNLALMKSVPAVISLDATPKTFDAMAAAYDAKTATGSLARLKTEWYRRAFHGAAGMVATSDWVRQSLIQDYGVSSDKIRVIPLGVDVQQWQPHHGTRLDSGPLRLLFVGGDFARKGGETLMKAFREGLADQCELHIVTKDEKVHSEESVHVYRGLTPNSPRLRQLFAESDIFVLPTQGDASPFVVMEAMAAGLPVITTRVGALEEQVQDGMTGYLIPADDPRAIIEKVVALNEDRARLAAMAKASRLAAEKGFNSETNYKELIGFLKQIASSRES